ncbi:hypothetical protein H5410_021832 [Solanum commersonii]|uniref:Uncharacterized protein n=1 Tax=Solanum commersonii TaxID=4109 RepID=A0A9J5ZF32_SOLCO|nr:hypothetical protein H5410_021832 [Solanum commersonii]
MVIIKRGWSEFLKDNKIASDETRPFKLIRGHMFNVLQTCNLFARVLNFRYLHKLSSYNYKYMYSTSALDQITIRNMLEDEQPSGLNKDK